MNIYSDLITLMENGRINEYERPLKIYERSYYRDGSTSLLMIKDDGENRIIAAGTGDIFDGLAGENLEDVKICPLSHANRQVLNKYIGFTNPEAAGKKRASIGLGDRLGRATPGHLKAVQGRGVFPVLAQQSIRELTLTGRDYNDVLDDAVFAVLQEGYSGGFGADGDHLKTAEEVALALSLGYTMITLDCSGDIHGTALIMDGPELEKALENVPADLKKRYASTYLGKTFTVGKFAISCDEETLGRIMLTYYRALQFIKIIYDEHIAHNNKPVDFEISIDETSVPTSPVAHYIIARELQYADIDITSLAPRFCGEFQKGVDYIGDMGRFEEEFKIHAAIAEEFCYKISIHSGSDKFSIFPIIGKYTGGIYHVKTAGTNWLEAMKVIALRDPGLYREIHAFALEHFGEARKYYHVTTDVEAIKPLASKNDDALTDYLCENNGRQLLHITYGLILQAKNESGGYIFKDRLFSVIDKYEDQYKGLLARHIGKHLDLLGI